MMRRVTILLLLCACRDDDDAPPVCDATTSSLVCSTSGSTSSAQAPDGADSTGAPETCEDAYHGNQDPGSAAAIELGADASGIAIGDLVVCSSAPSDFFVLQAECAGYLSVEIRRLDVRVPDLMLYDGEQPVEEILGVWMRFFLKPLQRHVPAGSHMLEVRHSGGDAQGYSLAAVLLPDSSCRP